MDEYQAPELMRTPLDEMVLQVKLFEPTGGATGTESHKIADFLSKAPEPPVSKAVESAVALLERIGALEEGTENLTLLGRHLAALPIPPMLVRLDRLERGYRYLIYSGTDAHYRSSDLTVNRSAIVQSLRRERCSCMG